ncbi:auxin efflux carrier [Morchella snyderi]|nr:auxin efflux carrier [Morchella snyderi]
MGFFTAPTSFRNNVLSAATPLFSIQPQYQMSLAMIPSNDTLAAFEGTMFNAKPHANHPALGNLILLVFEAVMEVVCVSLPGYIIARGGMFDADMQKFVANLNVSLFTPCLIFTKLASQLTLAKIVELAVIPVIFVVMTLVSYLCALMVCKICGFNKRARNFVIAMGVFGNSNSLPISLVISLSMTISGLHWDKLPNDNDEEVAARGILYLLIFQQLGQLVRWSWGYHVLLAPPPKVAQPENRNTDIRVYRDDLSDTESDLESQGVRVDPFMSPQFQNSYVGLHKQLNEPVDNQGDLLFPDSRHHSRKTTAGTSDSAFGSNGGPSGDHTPKSPKTCASSLTVSAQSSRPSTPPSDGILPTPTQGNLGNRDLTRFPRVHNSVPAQPRWLEQKAPFVSRVFKAIGNGVVRFCLGLQDFMNPPLYAMLAAVVVASIPSLQKLFFTQGTFLQNSVTRAVSQCGNVAVPLILVVLGANLAGNTQPKTNASTDRHETKLLFAALISRMVLPFVFIAPMLAIAAKFLNISILDDPIFVIVCFLLAGAPSALQLAQICQLNGVYESVMAKILFWSYVVVILPSTLILVITAIEVVEWAM